MRCKLLLILLFASLSEMEANAQSLKEYQVLVTGEVTNKLVLKKDDLLKMKRSEITMKDFSGLEYHYNGVALAEILKEAGALKGTVQGDDLAKYVLVRSGDGSEVVFSFAELDPVISGQTIILADQMNEKPLANGTGPFRIVVPNEKDRTRWIWEVNSIVIHYAKE